jgi:hypothetical protein
MVVDPRAELGLASPVLTTVAGNGTNQLGYVLAAGETMQIEAIAVDADATASGGSTVSVRYLAPSGEVIADSTTAAQLVGGTVSEVTFAPFLPDSADVGTIAGETQLQTGLVLTELPGKSTVHIEATDASVILTAARIWATGATGEGTLEKEPLPPVYLLPVEGEGRDPADFGGPA